MPTHSELQPCCLPWVGHCAAWPPQGLPRPVCGSSVHSSSSISFPTSIPPPFLVPLCSEAPSQAHSSTLWSDGYSSFFVLISMTQQHWCLTCSRHTKNMLLKWIYLNAWFIFLHVWLNHGKLEPSLNSSLQDHWVGEAGREWRDAGAGVV